MSFAKLKAWYASLKPEIRNRIHLTLIACLIIGLVQGFFDSMEFKVKSPGCRYSMLWDYNPARVLPCEILRKREPDPVPYVPPVQKKGRR